MPWELTLLSAESASGQLDNRVRAIVLEGRTTGVIIAVAGWYAAVGIYLFGIVSALAVEEVLRLIIRHAGVRARRSRLGRLVLRRSMAKHAAVEDISGQWETVLGDVRFPWVVAAYGPFRADSIESHFSPTEPPYPPIVEKAYQELCADVAQREARGEDVPFNGEGFKLVRFHASARRGPEEAQRLVLHFTPTTFFRMLVTDQRLDTLGPSGSQTLRETFARDIDLRTAPVPELATHWGVGLTVVTKDKYLLVSERGNTAVDAGVFFPAVAEGGSLTKDADPSTGAPDHENIAARGVEEELGAPLGPGELTWLSFGANAKLCEFALIGRVDTRFTFDELQRRRSVGWPKDSWESKRLHPIDFQPESVAEFLSDDARVFSPFALIAIVHTLVHEFGLDHCERAMRGCAPRVSESLPG